MSDAEYIKTIEADNEKLREKVSDLQKLVERYESLEKARYINDDRRQRELAAGKAWRDQVMKDMDGLPSMPENRKLKAYYKKKYKGEDDE